MGKFYLTILAYFAILSSSIAATTINYGDDLTAYFDAEGESHTYTFDATAGDKILFYAYEVLPSEGLSSLDAITLPETGTYTVLCMDENGNNFKQLQ